MTDSGGGLLSFPSPAVSRCRAAASLPPLCSTPPERKMDMTDDVTPIPTRGGTIPIGEPGICQKCGITIPTAYPGQPNTDNGLEVYFSGGYGEFIDTWDGDPMLWLCHECGHLLAKWLGLDVHNWHTHRPASGQHPDHHDE